MSKDESGTKKQKQDWCLKVKRHGKSKRKKTDKQEELLISDPVADRSRNQPSPEYIRKVQQEQLQREQSLSGDVAESHLSFEEGDLAASANRSASRSSSGSSEDGQANQEPQGDLGHDAAAVNVNAQDDFAVAELPAAGKQSYIPSYVANMYYNEQDAVPAQSSESSESEQVVTGFGFEASEASEASELPKIDAPSDWPQSPSDDVPSTKAVTGKRENTEAELERSKKELEARKQALTPEGAQPTSYAKKSAVDKASDDWRAKREALLKEREEAVSGVEAAQAAVPSDIDKPKRPYTEEELAVRSKLVEENQAARGKLAGVEARLKAHGDAPALMGQEHDWELKREQALRVHVATSEEKAASKLGFANESDQLAGLTSGTVLGAEDRSGDGRVSGKVAPMKGKVDFVMTNEGDLQQFTTFKDREVPPDKQIPRTTMDARRTTDPDTGKEHVEYTRHTSFEAGKEVAAAGELEFKNGKLVMINNASGHYMPNAGHLQQVIELLLKNGALLDQSLVLQEEVDDPHHEGQKKLVVRRLEGEAKSVYDAARLLEKDLRLLLANGGKIDDMNAILGQLAKAKQMLHNLGATERNKIREDVAVEFLGGGLTGSAAHDAEDTKKDGKPRASLDQFLEGELFGAKKKKTDEPESSQDSDESSMSYMGDEFTTVAANRAEVLKEIKSASKQDPANLQGRLKSTAGAEKPGGESGSGDEDESAPEGSDSGASPEEVWEQALAQIQPTYHKALQDHPDHASQLRAVLGGAQGKAEKEDFEGALKDLRRLAQFVADPTKMGNDASEPEKGPEEKQKAMEASRERLKAKLLELDPSQDTPLLARQREVLFGLKPPTSEELATMQKELEAEIRKVKDARVETVRARMKALDPDGNRPYFSELQAILDKDEPPTHDRIKMIHKLLDQSIESMSMAAGLQISSKVEAFLKLVKRAEADKTAPPEPSAAMKTMQKIHTGKRLPTEAEMIALAPDLWDESDEYESSSDSDEESGSEG